MTSGTEVIERLQALEAAYVKQVAINKLTTKLLETLTGITIENIIDIERIDNDIDTVWEGKQYQ